jgi:hypothetical protein
MHGNSKRRPTNPARSVATDGMDSTPHRNPTCPNQEPGSFDRRQIVPQMIVMKK